jgi:hypothetical protein
MFFKGLFYFLVHVHKLARETRDMRTQQVPQRFYTDVVEKLRPLISCFSSRVELAF